MLNQPHLQRGVSLIELMVGLAVFAIMLGIAIPNFSTFIQNSKIRTSAEAIQNGLSLARVEAVRRNTNVQFVLGAGTSWVVGCQTVTNDCPASIQSRAGANGSANIRVETSEVVATTGLAAGSAIFATTLSFNSVGRVTNATLPAGHNAAFDVVNPDGGTCSVVSGPMRCLRVVVTPGGQVRMCDPALTNSRPEDAQAC
ncbi:hypothetical protein D3C72_135480 [compost metagenome]